MWKRSPHDQLPEDQAPQPFTEVPELLETENMAELKSAKHELFCQEYVKDGNGARAYIASHGKVKGPKQSARRLLQRADIQARIAEIRANLAESAGLSQKQIIDDLEVIHKMGIANPEKGGLAAAHQAKAQQAKILGYTDQKSKQNVEELNDDEIVKQVREGTGNDRLANLWEVTLKYSMGHDISADLDKIEADLRQAAALSHSNGRDKQPPTAPAET